MVSKAELVNIKEAQQVLGGPQTLVSCVSRAARSEIDPQGPASTPFLQSTMGQRYNHHHDTT